MEEFQVANYTYRAGRLDAFKQFHVQRRLAPALLALTAGAAEQLAVMDQKLGQTSPPADGADGADPSKAEQLDSIIDPAIFGAMAKIMRPVAEALGSMKDEDVNFILNTCLAAVERKDGNGWQRVMTRGTLQYADIDAAVMMQLTMRVIQENLGGFFRGHLGGGPPGTPGQQQTGSKSGTAPAS